MIRFFLCLFSYFYLFAQDSNIEKIDRILSQKWDGREISIRKLDAGLTNENYQVNLESASYFVRCSSDQSDLLGICLEDEWFATDLASSAELAPKIIFYEPDEGIMVSEFIEGIKVDLREDAAMEKFCQLVRSLHFLKINLPREFCPFECIDSYAKNALDMGAFLPSELFEIILPSIDSMRSSLKCPTHRVPCHLDLHSGNVLDDGIRMYLVDWEYAAMGDPLFDLATAASVDYFSDTEMERFLQAYLGRLPLDEEFEYFFCMRILADARWALWSYLQAQISPIKAPYVELGDTFLHQCLKRISLKRYLLRDVF